MRAIPLISLLSLGACTLAMAPPPPTGPVAAPAGPAVQTADTRQAAAACSSAAAAQGLSVRGVENVSELRGSDGRATGQNVFLDVARGNSRFTLRCAYSYATSEARIMTL